jgi:hypothetical protein
MGAKFSSDADLLIIPPFKHEKHAEMAAAISK